MTIRSLSLLSALLAGIEATVSAQAIDTYQIRIYQQGSAVVLAGPVNTQATAVVCNLTPIAPPVTPPPNPTNVYWNDPVNAGRQCRVVMPNVLGTLKPGLYDVKVTAGVAGQFSAESSPFTFEKPGPPPVPTGVFVAN